MAETQPSTPIDLSFWLWVVVLLLFIVNLSFLAIFNTPAPVSDPSNALRDQVENDKRSFGQLSFWQRLLGQSMSTDTAVKKSQFDGLAIDPGTTESVVSVMVDNLAAARPQHSGIREASIVYEAMAEGGITRLMLIFPYQAIDRVGPVRSARDYFVDFAEAYGGLYIHAGGSPQALERLAHSARIYNLDEDVKLSGTTYSKRDERYKAPHNLYFDLQLVRQEAEKLGWNLHPTLTNWCFTDEALKSDANVTRIDLDFANSPTFESYVQFRYDAEQQHYLRFYGQKDPTPHTDQYDGLQVAPTNIIVQIAPSALIAGDVKERISLDDTGSGKAILYRDGKKIEGRWEKSAAGEATRYLDSDGNPFCLNPGQTWIAIIDSTDLVIETP